MTNRQPRFFTNSKARIGAEIRKARKAVGMTQLTLAELAGIDQSYLSKIELGRHSPTVQLLTKLSGGLGLEFIIGPDTVIFAVVTPDKLTKAGDD